MDWQYIVVGIFFIAALLYVVKSMRGNSKGHACGNGDCKVNTPAPKKNT
ncbi:MAG: hypothetical protein H7296_07180 [Bacteroidia bacterium]|nr:hypothetical protein [Bacteroidia bacterium]